MTTTTDFKLEIEGAGILAAFFPLTNAVELEKREIYHILLAVGSTEIEYFFKYKLSKNKTCLTFKLKFL